MSDGDTITAALFNNEYNQLVNAFTYSSSSASTTGHRHDGTAGQGGNIHTIGDLDFLNKIVADSTNNRWGFFVEVSSSAVEQIRIQDGAIVPVTDNDIDLGTSSLEFKDAYFDGTVTTDALVADTADINGGSVDGATLGTNSAITQAVIDSININGTTIGHTSDTDLITLTSGVVTIAGELDATTLDISGNADIDGTTNLDIVDIDGAVQIDATVTVGVDDTGYDVKFFGATASAYMLWDESVDDLILAGAARVVVPDGQLVLGSTAVSSTAAELNILDGKAFLDEDNMASNSATGIASQQSIKAYVDTQITAEDLDITTDSGTIAIDLDSETLTVSGGTGLDSSATGNAVTLAIDSTVATLTGSQTLTNKSLTTPTLTGTSVVASLDISGDIDVDGTTNLDAVDIDGAVQIDNTVTVGADDTGHDVKFFGATAGSYMLWDESTDDLILGGASRLGIGTTSPSQLLHLSGATNPTLRITDTTGSVVNLELLSGDSEAYLGTQSNHPVLFTTNNTERMRIGATGNATFKGRAGFGYTSESAAINPGIQVLTGGIGGGVQLNRETGTPSSGESLGSYAWKGQDGANTNAAAEALIEAVATADHSGSSAATKMVFHTKPSTSGPGNSPATALTLEANQNATFVGTVTCVSVTETSDAALKTNVQPIENALAAVNALQGVTYDDIETGDKRIGFIAQDVQRDAPDLAERVVLEADPETKMLGISYSHMTSVLAEAIKEQQSQIETLTKRIEELEA